MSMDTRLQVLLPAAEMKAVRQAARREGVSVGEWVRRALRAARGARSLKDPAVKLEAIRRAGSLHLPTGDIEQLLSETERGRWFDLP